MNAPTPTLTLAAPDVFSRADEFGRWMIGLLAEKLGAEGAMQFVDAILEPTRGGTPERRASDKSQAQLTRNLLAVAGGAA